jgi:hypothetical protein
MPLAYPGGVGGQTGRLAACRQPDDAGAVDDVDRVLERTIDALLDARRPGASICRRRRPGRSTRTAGGS